MDVTTLIVSVVVGIGTGVLANFATYLFVHVFLPKYRDLVYQGTRVSGTWVICQSNTPSDGDPLSTVWALSATLEQKAYVLKGNATASLVEKNLSLDAINYTVTGHIYDRFVVLMMRNNDPARIAHSTFLLEVKGDGNQMIGYRSFYGLYDENIRAVACKWKRGFTANAACFAQPEVTLLAGRVTNRAPELEKE